MPLDYSVNSLLTSVKQRAMTASNQNLFQDDDIVRIASESLQEVVVPFIESVKGEYFVTYQDVPFVSGVTAYTLPERATGSKLRDVCLLDAQGNEVNLNYINPEDLKSAWANVPYQFGFYPRNNDIVLVLGNLIGSGNYTSVRMKYFRRPNVLVPTSSAGQVLSIDPNTNEVTLTAVPTTWTAATVVDCIQSIPPFNSHGDDQTLTTVAGFILTFTSLPANLKVGDWIAESNMSPIAQVPVECHRLLETLTAARMLQYSGDPSFQVFQAQATEQKKDLTQVINPRVDGSPRKIMVRNRLWW